MDVPPGRSVLQAKSSFPLEAYSINTVFVAPQGVRKRPRGRASGRLVLSVLVRDPKGRMPRSFHRFSRTLARPFIPIIPDLRAADSVHRNLTDSYSSRRSIQDGMTYAFLTSQALLDDAKSLPA